MNTVKVTVLDGIGEKNKLGKQMSTFYFFSVVFNVDTV